MRQETNDRLPLHINSITGEIDELCYIDVLDKRYIVTHIQTGFILLRRVGYKEVLILINTTIEHEFTFSVLFEDKNIPLKNVDFSINRVITYFNVVNAIYEHYYHIVR